MEIQKDFNADLILDELLTEDEELSSVLMVDKPC